MRPTISTELPEDLVLQRIADGHTGQDREQDSLTWLFETIDELRAFERRMKPPPGVD